MGMLESYLAAPLIALAGPSWPVLRLPLLALYALFLWLIYRLTRRLCSPWFATFVVGLLALGSERVVRDQLTVVGGRPEVKAAVLAMLLIAVGLAERPGPAPPAGRRGCSACSPGWPLWSDWLILPYLAVAGLVLLWAARRELLGWPGVLLVAGFLVGVAPMIRDNLVAPPGQDSLSVFREISTRAGPTPPWSERMRGGLLEGVPLAHGLCPIDGCARWQRVVRPALPGAAGGRRGARAGRVPTGRRCATGPSGSGRSCSSPWSSAPALTLLVVRRAARSPRPTRWATPATCRCSSSPCRRCSGRSGWPRWPAGGARSARRAGSAGAVATAVLAALAATAAGGHRARSPTPARRRRGPRSGRPGSWPTRCAPAGLREVYGDYWTCNRLIFNTGEAVVCGVLDGGLTPGQNRYLAYWRQVARADRPGYVVEAGSPLERRLRRLLGDRADAAAGRPRSAAIACTTRRPPVRPWR